MKDYYAILQLKRFASTGEVRRAYRVLVQKYHPDVNPTASAAVIIREVNEAYEVLGDEQKKRLYDNRLVTPVQQTIQQQPRPQPAQHRDPRYRNPFKPSVKKDSRQFELMKEYMGFVINTSKLGCVICLFLVMDVLLPKRIINDSVKQFFNNYRVRATTTGILTESDRSIKLGDSDVFHLKRGMKIEISETSIASITTSIYVPETNQRITNLATIYRNYVFVPILLLITSVLCLLMKGQVEMKFNLGIVSFVLTIFTLILIFK